MGARARKSVLELPVKMVLTDTGTTFFIKNNRRLSKFRMIDKAEEYGLQVDSFSAVSLPRMILSDYVTRLETTPGELALARQGILDMSKLVMYSILYRQFNAYIMQRILASEAVRSWNRKNPLNCIDERTGANLQALGGFAASHGKDIGELKNVILAPILAFITRNSSLLPEEKNVQILLCEKFLDTLNPFIWFVLAKFRSGDGFDQLVKELRTSLASYMDKAKIAEYLALNVMELASNAENNNLRREAQIAFKGTIDTNAILFDRHARDQVFESLRRKGDLVSIAWKIGSKGASIGTNGKLAITIFNRESEYGKRKEAFEDGKNADLKKRTLHDFYLSLPEGESSTDLGLYYLSYLSEACDKVNIKFEALVNQISGSDLTVVTLAVNI